MGGREVGYLSNGLPGYRDVRNKEDRKYMEKFWKTKGIKETPGPTITEAIDLILEGKIKLMWVVCTNPAVSLPDLNKVHKALRNVFLIVQDAYWNDTTEFADIILPACVLGEKEGTMTGSDRTVTLCKRFRQPVGDSKPDWLIFKEIAAKMGFKGFDYNSPEDIFNEFKKTTAGRLCDISGFEYNRLPSRWGGRWLYSDLKFPTNTGKAKFYPVTLQIPKETGRFIMVTGRLKNQWHTMTKTGKSPELLKGEIPPFIIMNPQDAKELDINEGDKVIIVSERGKVERIVRYGNVKRGHIFAPFGYPTEFGEPTNILVNNRVDPLSKEPDLKYTGIDIIK